MPTWNDLLVTSHGWSPSSTCSGGRRGDRSPGSTTRTQIKFVAASRTRRRRQRGGERYRPRGSRLAVARLRNGEDRPGRLMKAPVGQLKPGEGRNYISTPHAVGPSRVRGDLGRPFRWASASSGGSVTPVGTGGARTTLSSFPSRFPERGPPAPVS
jgi:hypothetical protein